MPTLKNETLTICICNTAKLVLFKVENMCKAALHIHSTLCGITRPIHYARIQTLPSYLQRLFHLVYELSY